MFVCKNPMAFRTWGKVCADQGLFEHYFCHFITESAIKIGPTDKKIFHLEKSTDSWIFSFKCSKDFQKLIVTLTGERTQWFWILIYEWVIT